MNLKKPLNRIATPPSECIMQSGSIVSVELKPDEDVDWNYIHTSAGKVCNGYRIRKRMVVERERMKGAS